MISFVAVFAVWIVAESVRLAEPVKPSRQSHRRLNVERLEDR